MKNLIPVYFLAVIICLLFGCKKKDPALKTNPPYEISAQIEQLNSDDDFFSSVESVTVKFKRSGWLENVDGSVDLLQELMFDMELENGKELTFGFWFRKIETDTNLLVLMDEDISYWERKWDYMETGVEASNFYEGFDEARVLINNNVTFHEQNNSTFNIVEVMPVLVDGEEKSYVTIEFEGTAFGWYDPNGEHQEVYSITNGIFRGVIEE